MEATTTQPGIPSLINQCDKIIQTTVYVKKYIYDFTLTCPESEGELLQSAEYMTKLCRILPPTIQYELYSNSIEEANDCSSMATNLESIQKSLDEIGETVLPSRNETVEVSPEPSWRSSDLVNELNTRLEKQADLLDRQISSFMMRRAMNESDGANVEDDISPEIVASEGACMAAVEDSPAEAPAPTSKGDQDIPPAYESLEEKTEEPSEKQDKKQSKKQTGDGALQRSSPLTLPELQPTSVHSVPRKTREFEKVHASLSPDGSYFALWSVDSLEVYSTETGSRLWQKSNSHPDVLVNDYPPLFLPDLCFSPKGTIVCMHVSSPSTKRIMAFRVSDGQFLGRRNREDAEGVALCVSNSDKLLAVAKVPTESSASVKTYPLEWEEASCPSQTLNPNSNSKKLKDGLSLNADRVFLTFSPDDEFLMMCSESSQEPVINQSHRVLRIAVVSTVTGKLVRAIERKSEPLDLKKAVRVEPRFMFLPDENCPGQHRWLVGFNEPGCDAFTVVDIKRDEKVMVMPNNPLRNPNFFFGAFGGNLMSVQAEFDAGNGTYTYVARKDWGKTSKMCLIRGIWNWEECEKSRRNEQKRRVLSVKANDNWCLSKDGRLAVIFHRDETVAEVIRL